MEGEESGAADEEYSNECSNYTEEDDDVISDGNDEDEKDENVKRNQGSDVKTNGSMGEGLNAAAQKYLEERKEVTYSAYGNNLESTIKLLSCSKNVNLIDNKKDVKAKRMFVTSFASIKE